MSRTNVGLSAIYNGGLAPGISIGAGRHGRGLMDMMKGANEFMKKHKIISKIGSMAGEKGYGKKKKSSTPGRMRVGTGPMAPFRSAGSKTATSGGRRRRKH